MQCHVGHHSLEFIKLHVHHRRLNDNLDVAYILNTLSRVCTRRLAVLDGKCLIVIKLKPPKEVTKNGKPFTNITSATNVTFLCSFTKSRGICTYWTQMHSGFVLVIFLLRLARSGPKIQLALSTSCMVIGQLVNSCSRTIPTNSLSVGFAIMPWMRRASLAFLTSWCVYPSNSLSQYSGALAQCCCLHQTHHGSVVLERLV
jgi:hypothetical protein